MPQTLADFVKARALGQLVAYHNHLGGRESDWEQVAVYAFREWRNSDPEIILALVRMAKAAKIAASMQTQLKDGERLDDSCIPGLGA